MKQSITTFFLMITILLLSSCSQNASHLPSILDIPSAIGSVFENASYNAKRKKVAAYVTKHYLSLRKDVKQGGGSILEGAFDVAGIKQSKRSKAKELLMSSQKTTFENAGLVADSLIQVFATLYVNQSSAKDKRINGFTYFDAKQLITHFAENNFEALRLAIKQGQGASLDSLMGKLNITNSTNKDIFRSKSKSLYYRIYLDIVVTSIMINT